MPWEFNRVKTWSSLKGLTGFTFVPAVSYHPDWHRFVEDSNGGKGLLF
jgi:hypothetical protein